MMARLNLILVSLFILVISCSQTTPSAPVIHKGSSVKVEGEQVAYFAQGCFWHSEIVFQSLKGVRDAVSGYSGGHLKDPTYENVGTGRTGHAEAVKVFYDPRVISFNSLVDAYFASMDPTSVNRQGNDAGTQYRSILFYADEIERKIILDAMNKLKSSGKYKKPLAVEVKKIDRFYIAENYHQEYILNNPGNTYVKRVSIPDYIHFRKSFKGKFK